MTRFAINRRSDDHHSSPFVFQARCRAALIPLVICFYLVSAYGYAQTGDWVWMNGSNQLNQNGNRGTLQVASSVNSPGGRTLITSWTDNNGNLWLFGGVDPNGNSYNDIWEFNAITLEWTWMAGPSTPNQPAVYGTLGTASQGNVPGVRSGAVTWKDLEGNFWLFGGSGRDSTGAGGYLNDLWEFSPSTLQWTWMGGANVLPTCPSTNSCGSPGIYGTLGTPAPNNVPPGRGFGMGWVDLSGNFWLFGGRIYVVYLNGWTGYENDLWKYSPATNQWTWMGGQSSLPSDCGLTTDCGYSGTYGTQLVSSALNTPGSRENATTWSDPAGDLWLLGGDGFDSTHTVSLLNDLWKFDPNAGTWEWVSGSNTAGALASSGDPPGSYGVRLSPATTNHPGGRRYALGWTDAVGNLWLFGGNGYDGGGKYGTLGDLWRFTPSTNEWTWMTGSSSVSSSASYGTFAIADPANDPGSRSNGISWADVAGNLWLFGGTSPQPGGNYDDAWEYLLYGPPHAVPPIFSLAGGSYTGPQSVAISDTAPNTTIYYTTDGTIPTASSTTYAGPIHLGHTQTINAIATETGYAQSAVSSAAFTIIPAQPVINWPLPASIIYGTALSSTQLDATTTSPGSLSYSPGAGTVLSAGTHILTVSFTPDLDSGYASGSSSVSLFVSRAIPTVNWPTPAPITYGTPLSSTQLNASSSVPGTFTYNPAAGTVLSAGNQTLRVAFTPTDTTDYTTASSTVQINVKQAVPQLTWPTPTAITYGTALTSAQLNATATVPGSFVYSPALGTVLHPGQQTLSVTFNPTDTTDYTTASSTVQINVKQAVPQLTWPTPAAITYGAALTSTQLDATSTIPGTFVYSPAPGTVPHAGQQTLSTTFTPTDSTDFTTAASTVTLVVNQATPVISWPAPAAVNYGTALSSIQLNASASVPGIFAYSPAAGTVPPVGSDTLSVTFTPSDAIDYATAASSVTLVVNPYNPSPGIASLSPAIALAGGPAFTLTVRGLAFQPASTVYWGTTALPTQYVSATQLLAQVPAADIAAPGTASITVQTPAPGGGTSNALVFQIDSASGSTPPSFTTASFTVSSGASASYPVTLPASATSISVTCLNLPAGATCTYSATTGVLIVSTSPTTPTGTYQITAVFNETLPGAATATLMLPFLVLPIFYLRKRLLKNGWIMATVVLAFVVSAVSGCGGAGSGGSSNTTPQTHPVTSSATVTLIVQ